MAITIVLNGKNEEVQDNITIGRLLELKNIRPEVVTVEANEIILDKSRFKDTVLKQNDRVEFVYFMGGGSKEKKCGSVVAKSVLELIGNTPMVELNRITEPGMAKIIAKLESYNPGGSVKDRIALAMIEDAEKRGLIKEGATIVEPTSGNTGIGIALVCAVKSYKCILTMPETMSLERIYILRSYGAEIILTPGAEGMSGAIKKAEEISNKAPNSIILQQFNNPANPEVHRNNTVKELLDATDNNIDAFVAGVGTGGTITGVGEGLKKVLPGIRVIAVEPETSAVLSGEKSGPHKIQGIGAGFIPEILNRDVIDEIIKVGDNEAFRTSRELARKEGIFAGISAGAAVKAALKVAKDLGEGKTVVVILPDTGERYFSMEQYFEA